MPRKTISPIQKVIAQCEAILSAWPEASPDERNDMKAELQDLMALAQVLDSCRALLATEQFGEWAARMRGESW